TRALWLIDYADLSTYAPETLTAGRYLAAGWAVIAGAKWQALAANLQSLVAVQGNIVAFPFALLGAWRLRRQPLFQAAALYAGLLFLAMTFAFTWPGLFGGFLHSGTALLVFMGPAALVGLDTAVEAAARRLKHWQPERSKPIFMTLLVAGVCLLAVLRFPAAAAGTRAADAVYAEIGGWLEREAGGPAVVAVNNPPAFKYHTGWPAIVVPAGGPDMLLRAMADFQARWLVLDVNVAPGLAGLYDQPAAEPRLRLRATFQDAAGRPVYLLERLPDP
ncbi:MAG: hypothetical protein JNK29_10750, partial [Anaerolineales bacterium]|nr:hypothetical protein [Anaerolineales bacterium]